MSDGPDRPLLQCARVGKRFGGVRALADVDFTLRAGEVHGVVGGNGAGKSTLMKILAGALPDHEGSVLLDGRPVELSSPREALARGIAMVYQELSGVGQLSVAENVCLGRQPRTRWGLVDWPRIRSRARRQLRELDIDVDVTARLGDFPLGIRQMVEVARGIHSGARVLILDEPTSALSAAETGRLFSLIRKLCAGGVAVVFISHFIEDVLEISDRVTILRNGRRIQTSPAAELDRHYVIRTMLQHDLAGAEAGYETVARLPPKPTGRPTLVARGLSVPGAIFDASLEVHAGECLGLYGLVGAGHQQLAHALAGAVGRGGGQVLLDGRPLKPGSCHDAVGRGVALVTADRARGLFMRGRLYKNVTLAHLHRAVGQWLTAGREIAAATPVLQRVGCRFADPRMAAGDLSGGNQQKAALARWMLGPLKVLVLDEPTRGMDVEAKEEVMRLVADLKARGLAVVLASVEPEMHLAHADRVLTVSRGRITGELAGIEVSKPMLMQSC